MSTARKAAKTAAPEAAEKTVTVDVTPGYLVYFDGSKSAAP